MTQIRRRFSRDLNVKLTNLEAAAQYWWMIEPEWKRKRRGAFGLSEEDRESQSEGRKWAPGCNNMAQMLIRKSSQVAAAWNLSLQQYKPWVKNRVMKSHLSEHRDSSAERGGNGGGRRGGESLQGSISLLKGPTRSTDQSIRVPVLPVSRHLAKAYFWRSLVQKIRHLVIWLNTRGRPQNEPAKKKENMDQVWRFVCTEPP